MLKSGQKYTHALRDWRAAPSSELIRPFLFIRDRFMRCSYTDVSVDPKAFVFGSDHVRRLIGA